MQQAFSIIVFFVHFQNSIAIVAFWHSVLPQHRLIGSVLNDFISAKSQFYFTCYHAIDDFFVELMLFYLILMKLYILRYNGQ